MYIKIRVQWTYIMVHTIVMVNTHSQNGNIILINGGNLGNN